MLVNGDCPPTLPAYLEDRGKRDKRELRRLNRLP